MPSRLESYDKASRCDKSSTPDLSIWNTVPIPLRCSREHQHGYRPVHPPDIVDDGRLSKTAHVKVTTTGGEEKGEIVGWKTPRQRPLLVLAAPAGASPPAPVHLLTPAVGSTPAPLLGLALRGLLPSTIYDGADKTGEDIENTNAIGQHRFVNLGRDS